MINTFRNLVTGYLPDVWPIIVIITVIVCSLRVAVLLRERKHICFYKEIFNLLFVIYVMCLFEVVTVQDDNYGLSNFIPFHEMTRYTFGSKLFVRNILGNIILFVPYGYFAADYVKSKKIWATLYLTLLVSATIEFVQFNIGRTYDIDDCILNTIGGCIGFLIYYITNKISDYLPSIFKSDGFISFIVVLLLIFGIIYLCDIQLVDLIR